MRWTWIVLLAACGAGCEPPGWQPVTRPVPSARQGAQDAAPTASESLTGTVVAIADGDSFTVRTDGTEQRIRMYGIDCPEGGQPFGDAARQFTRDAISGKTVRIEVRDRDQYGRLVGIVTLPDESVLNHALVQAGLAWHYVRNAPDDRELAALEAEARADKRGLWSAADPIAPWQWRTNQRRQAAAQVAVVANGVEIAAVLPNPKGPDEGNERVRIANTSAQPVALDGWKLQDAGGQSFALAGTVPAGGQVEIRLAPPSMPLNNDGDQLLLIDDQGTVRSRVAYEADQAQSGTWIDCSN